MKTDKLKRIIVNYQSPTIKRWISLYDCNKTIIDLRSCIFSFANKDVNNIKFQGIKFIRKI